MFIPDLFYRVPRLNTIYTVNAQPLSYIIVLYDKLIDFIDNDDNIKRQDCSIYIRSTDLVLNDEDFSFTLTYAHGDDLVNARLLSLFNAYTILEDIRIGATLRKIIFQ